MLKNIAIVILFAAFQGATAQNLIDNPGFELATEDPKGDITGDNNFTCTGWTAANASGTPDYYTAARKGPYSVPRNGHEIKHAHGGNAYAAIVAYPDPDFAFSEDIQCRLNQKLVKDGYYCLSLYICPAQNRHFSTNEMNFYLSQERVTCSHCDIILLPDHQKLTAPKGIFQPKAWNRIAALYKAKGGEEYLTIGLFSTTCRLISFDLDDHEYKGMYFYIDDVSLVPVSDTAACKCNKIEVFKDEAINYSNAADKPVVLKNIYFNPGQAQLLPASNDELNRFSGFLKANPAFTVEITGHTDDTGREEDNVVLSAARAQSVADFLVRTGIAKDRIVTRGQGSRSPVVPNTSDENRQQNRRVEFRMIKT